MRSPNLLLGIAALCVALMAPPHMVHAVPLSQFYPYGSAEDSVLQGTDDDVSAAISLAESGFRYFGRIHRSIYVSFYVT